MSGMRILAIHAHPDDEASKGAATMARYASEGHLDARTLWIRQNHCAENDRGF